MIRYLLYRLPSALVVLALASFGIFALVRMVPGDPASTLAGPDATPETLAATRHELGLDQPLLTQYLAWLRDVFTLDLGRSYLLGGQVSDLVIAGAANTLVLTVAAMTFAILLALILSVVSVLGRSRAVAATITGFTTASMALPTFVTGLGLVVLFTVVWPVLPSGGLPPDGFTARPDFTAQYLLLPSIALGLPVAGVLTRHLTESLRSELRQPYVATATAAGVPRRRVVLAWALPNALPASLTVLGVQVGQLLGGAVLVEAIFAWPGLGLLIEQAISARDYPVVQVVLLISVATFVVIQLLTDLAHAWLDPRVRLGGTR